MAATTVQGIFDSVHDILQDASGTRWSDKELLGWLNRAYQQVVLHRPDANSRSYRVQFEHSDSCHRLDTMRDIGASTTPLANALRLLDITRNVVVVGADGDADAATGAEAIMPVAKEQFDSQLRKWVGGSATTSIEHYVYDERNPKEVLLYPRPKKHSDTKPSTVEVVVSEAVEGHPIQSDGTVSDDTKGEGIKIDETYVDPLVDYIVSRCYQKDADTAGSADLSRMHMDMFLEAMGAKTRADVATAPGPVPEPAEGN